MVSERKIVSSINLAERLVKTYIFVYIYDTVVFNFIQKFSLVQLYNLKEYLVFFSQTPYLTSMVVSLVSKVFQTENHP